MNRLFLFTLTVLCAFVTTRAQETMEQAMFESMRDDDKAVIVAVHKDTESGIGRTGIERLNQRLRNAYPTYTFREACTTQGAMAQTPDPDELFSQLEKDGYTHVLVQSSSLTNDLDVQYLRHIVEAAKGKFKHVRLGEPLLSDRSDYEKVADIAINTFSVPKEMNVLVCNGNGEDDASYMLLDYILRDESEGDWMLATTNGIPTLDHLVQVLKRQKVKKVHLVPFNTEASSSMRSEWMKKLQQAGCKVTMESRTLIDQEGVAKLFEEHVRQAEQFRRLTPKEQKIITR
jgi:sirohydrochlorin cobaltochelatase